MSASLAPSIPVDKEPESPVDTELKSNDAPYIVQDILSWNMVDYLKSAIASWRRDPIDITGMDLWCGTIDFPQANWTIRMWDYSISWFTHISADWVRISFTSDFPKIILIWWDSSRLSYYSGVHFRKKKGGYEIVDSVYEKNMIESKPEPRYRVSSFDELRECVESNNSGEWASIVESRKIIELSDDFVFDVGPEGFSSWWIDLKIDWFDIMIGDLLIKGADTINFNLYWISFFNHSKEEWNFIVRDYSHSVYQSVYYLWFWYSSDWNIDRSSIVSSYFWGKV